ncbi:acyl-CoA-binding domain-containing protein 4 [Nymphaea colorata]|nr:acyl-CoA-binding domain-containing protein 4 [Nymphaea colorata]XP_031502218.1 acyl-CoA-binding domain-containing protein 4 [Nymphaea colorata]
MEAFQPSSIPYDQWIPLPTSGPRPSARYKHAAEVVEGKLYVVGGDRNGRYMSDVHILDFKTLTWTAVKPTFYQEDDLDGRSHEPFPASSCHRLVKWGNKLIAVGGYMKHSPDTVTVRAIDVDTHCWSVVQTFGEVPAARGGHSVTLVGSRLFMFGGEGAKGRLLNDLHVLYLETMKWDTVKTTQELPLPRFDHAAAVHAERYLLIFGGCSRSACLDDLHILDLHTMEWSQPQIQGEVNARAGHAGAVIGENWYIAGGGDNKSGARGTLVLSLSKLVWSVLTDVEEQHPVASEGLTLTSFSSEGEKLLVAFGGYNGKYNNEVFILKPTLKSASQPKILKSPAAAAAAASVKAVYELTRKGETLDLKVDTKEVTRGSSKQDTVEKDSLSARINLLKSALLETRTNNSKHKDQLDEKNQTYAELSKELHSVQEQLTAERLRCSELEIQISDLREKLESSHSLQQELQLLQVQLSIFRQDPVAMGPSIQRKRSGLFNWIAGTPGNPDEDKPTH